MPLISLCLYAYFAWQRLGINVTAAMNTHKNRRIVAGVVPNAIYTVSRKAGY
jgi:hypothetical protein